MQVEFMNPKDGWITCSRWRELRLKKDPLEEIIEAGFFASTTREDCRVLPRKKYSFLRFLIEPVFAGK